MYAPKQVFYKVAALITTFVALASSTSWAANREWTEVPVPGASCGNGEPYSIFLSAKDPLKLVFAFKGGGACWDDFTCFGPVKTTTLTPSASAREPQGIFSTDPKVSPVTDYTFVYFPYCTGDVHVGTHTVKYLFKKAHHVGRRNVEKAMQLLADRQLVDLRQAQNVVLYGYSAGAIGALYHIRTIDPYLGPTRNKTLIIDAPGLHFGGTFWRKFPPQLLADYKFALSIFGMKFDQRDGVVADVIPKLCAQFPDWRIGTLQASQDLIMSYFGDIPPWRQHQATFSRRGIFKITADRGDYCSAWVPVTAMHTFMVKDHSGKECIAQGVTAQQYVQYLIEGREEGRFNYDGRRAR